MTCINNIRKTMVVIKRSYYSGLLPKLPVPPLKGSLTKYLRTVKPLVTLEEYTKTEMLVNNFVSPNNEGEKLQLLLEKRAQIEENWLSQWWLDTAYLEYRMPVVVFSSPGLAFPRQSFNSQMDQLDFVARLLLAIMDYKTIIDEGQIPIEKSGNDFLDMSQYTKVFGTYREPSRPRDKLLYNSKSKHVVVMHNNHAFKLNLWNNLGQRLNKGHLMQALLDIVSRSSTIAVPVGILTSDSRDNWNNSHKLLLQEPQNTSSLNMIKSSLFILSLDQVNNAPSYNDQSATGMQLIHGCGSKSNGGNRWFDKTIQR
uniref:Choline/carnitine acyltransferase domain-containing protein n=1 Tax=Clastoptera arizonana TaxID=38151 RepID=A0A1B6DQU1_9HEMI